jgi:hypothetical protein
MNGLNCHPRENENPDKVGAGLVPALMKGNHKGRPYNKL